MARAKPIRKGDFIQVMHQGTVFRATCTDARAGIISVAREFVPEGVGKSWFKREECKRLGDGPDTPQRGETVASTFFDDGFAAPQKGWWINVREIRADGVSMRPDWWGARGNQSYMSQDKPKNKNTDGWAFLPDPDAKPTNDEEE